MLIIFIYNKFRIGTHIMKSILEFLTPKKATFFINSKSTLRQVVEKFYAHRFTVVPLVDDNGKYVGTISQGDVLRFIKERNDLSIESLEDVGVMDIEHYRSYLPLRINAEIVEVLTLSLEQNFVPIVDDLDTYIGIIKRSDIIKYLYREMTPILNKNEDE